MSRKHAITIAILMFAFVVGGNYLIGLYHAAREPTKESGNQSTPVGSCGGSSDWKLVWGDEFNGTGLPNSADWDFLNGEAVGVKTVYYTNRLQNIKQHDGNLLITLIREHYEGKPYTSGGIVNNESKHAIVYGRFEARMKFTKGHTPGRLFGWSLMMSAKSTSWSTTLTGDPWRGLRLASTSIMVLTIIQLISSFPFLTWIQPTICMP